MPICYIPVHNVYHLQSIHIPKAYFIFAVHLKNIDQASKTKAINKDNRILIKEAQQVANTIGTFDIQRILPSNVSNAQNVVNNLVLTERTKQTPDELQLEIKELQGMQAQLQKEIAEGSNQKKEKLLLHIKTQIQTRQNKQNQQEQTGTGLQHGEQLQTAENVQAAEPSKVIHQNVQDIPQQLIRPPNQQQVIKQQNNIKTQLQNKQNQHQQQQSQTIIQTRSMPAPKQHYMQNKNQVLFKTATNQNINHPQNRQMQLLNSGNVKQVQFAIQREPTQGMLYQQPLAMMHKQVIQPATARHLIVPLRALSLDNIIQNQILPKRYVMVNSGAGLVQPDVAVRPPTTTMPTAAGVPITPPTYRSRLVT